MKTLLKYLNDYKKETILAPLFKMLEALFELFVPLVMAKVIDVGIANKDGSYILKMCLILVALGLIGLTCSITAQYFSAKAATGFAKDLRSDLFKKIQSFTYGQIDSMGTATLITRMTSDVNQMQSGVNLTLRLFLRSPFIVFGSMVMAFTVDAKAALVFVVIIPVLSLVVFGIMLITMPLYKKVQSLLDKVLLITRENLTGVRVIRAFNKEKHEEARFRESNGMLADAQKHVGRISGLMNPLTYLLVNLALVVLIYVGAVRVNIGSITQGAVVALINYMSQILVELVKLADLIITMTKAAACGNRVLTVMETSCDMEDGTREEGDENGSAAVEFDHVSMAYPGGGADSLSDITFTAMRGETIGIIGGTGCGKSTLVNLIARFYEATGGEVRVCGANVSDYRIEALRKKIGIVPQKAVLFLGTIAENIRFGNEDATDEQIISALQCAQAWEFVERKEGQLSFMVEQNGRNLSGGQKQRLSIARALVRDPEILILDDSASALDFATDAKLRRAIAERAKTATVFLVSQRASTVQGADRILVLDDGRLVGSGSHELLIESCEVYKEIYYSQFPKEAQDEDE